VTHFRHIVRVLVALGLVGLVVSGCIRGRVGGGPLRDAQGRTVIDFWNGFTGPDGKMMERIVRQFKKENPDIEIRMQIIPWGTYYDKVTLSLAYGGAPEVFIMHAGRLPEFASFDVLAPLDSLYATMQPPLKAEEFAPAPWEASFYQGRRYGLPLDVHPWGLYYNKQLFKEAGIVDAQGNAKPPATWDEFLDAAKRMTKDTDGDGRPDQWGFVFTFQRNNALTFLYQHGADLISEDGKRATLDTPEVIAAVSKMRDLIYRYKVAPKPEGVDAWLAFRQGKVGMALEGIYMLASLEEQTGLPYAGAPTPQFGTVRQAWAGSHLLCQPAGIRPEMARAAWRFMRYLSDQSLQWAKGGQVPARLAVVRTPEFQALPVQAQYARQLPYVRYEPLSPKLNALFPFFDPAIEAVLLNLQTPEAAMRDANRRINQVLQRP
jgi:multiple sugar transport system substrate-binding protein